MSDEKRYPHERWVIAGWLNSSRDTDPFNDPKVENYLQSLMANIGVDKIATISIFQTICHEMSQGTMSPSKRQQARINFHGGHISVLQEKTQDAYDYFNECLRLLEDGDWLSKLQVASWAAATANFQHFHTLAITLYDWIISLDSKSSSIPFVQGDWASMRCNAYLQRATAFIGGGEFQDAESDIQSALISLSQWLGGNHPSQDTGSKLNALLAGNHAKLYADDKLSQIWCDLFLWIPWQYAIRVTLQFSLQPETINLATWEIAYNLLTSAAAAGEKMRLDQLASIPKMHIRRAEIVMAILPFIKDEESEKWLEKAENALLEAEAIGALTHAGDNEKDFTLLLRLVRYRYQMWRATQQTNEPEEDITDLIHLTNEILSHAGEIDIPHAIGRCHFLLGELYEALGDTSESDAQFHYQEALKIFERLDDGYIPRRLEAQRALARFNK